jgi:hypothetical protein
LSQFKYFEVFNFEGFVLFENCFLTSEFPFELFVKFFKDARVGPTGIVIFDDVTVIFKHFQLALQFLNIRLQHLILLSKLFVIVLLVLEFKDYFFEQFRIVVLGLIDLPKVDLIAYPFEFSHS